MIPFQPKYILEVLPELLSFLPITLYILVATTILGSLLGLIIAKQKIKGTGIGFRLANLYLSVIRCTPPIVLLFIIYYGLPQLLITFNIDINNFHKGFFVIISFTILFSANISEVMRSAYKSIDNGQTEAALSIGLSPIQAFLRIVLPQATIVALPNFCNALVNLMKDGSLAYIIGLIDMMGAGNNIISRNYGNHAIETFVALAIIYWVLTLILEQSFKYLEKKLGEGRQSLA